MNLSAFARTAHRGLFCTRDGIPENSLPAFERAVRLGCAAELDVRCTLDGVPVVFHDWDLQRMTGVHGGLPLAFWRDLRQLRLSRSPYGIPLFSEVLGLVRGRIPLLVDIKNEGLAGEVEEAVARQLADYHGMCAVMSFNPLSLLWFRRHMPLIPRGQAICGEACGIPDELEAIVRDRMLPTFQAKPAFAAYSLSDLSPELCEKFRAKGVGLLGWTVRTPAEFEAARRLGVGIIFERECG